MWKVVSGGCAPTPTPATPTPPPQPTPTSNIPSPAGWRLVWNDEFNNSAIDTTKWSFEVNGQGGGNNELQYYTARNENARIENGKLVIEARRENYTGPDGTRQYTSARLRSLGKGDWTYGRFEARMKLPYGQGLWPAFWMLPTDWVYGGWAASGELDIMEAINLKAAGGNVTYGSIHYGGVWPNNTHKTISTVPGSSMADNFHDYAVEWEPGVIRWYVDGQYFGQQTDWYSSAGAYPAPFNQRFHLLLNVAVGGNWPGNPDATTSFPQRMEVDWVRVFQR
ncbi:glycoside hydrolase family 16 protein [Chitiniphilus eburneus]|uniref:Glycoside hydrolase family 16 protein n=1 Tax=Chitiniphilus eburneus TaxID=2571148 RepID=A0A4U0PUK5_9NEIS|nr:glycoside hydrolase family 16 protein [Chitiniphilus eburneus]